MSRRPISAALIMSAGQRGHRCFSPLIFLLLHQHSFLIRRRSREFGLYNVLGMGKGNIARILLWETLLSCGAATFIGLALGILLSKLAEAGPAEAPPPRGSPTPSTVSIPSLLLTLGLFAAIHALIFLRSLWELHRVSAVALLTQRVRRREAASRQVGAGRAGRDRPAGRRRTGWPCPSASRWRH